MKKISLVVLCLILLSIVPTITSCGLPTAAFTVSAASGPAPLSVTFTNTTQKVSADSKIVFDWDFGDGAKQTAARVTDAITHEYTKAWTYTVTMTCYSSDDPAKTGFLTQTITVTHGSLSTVVIKPDTVELKIGGTQKFTSSAFDKFENPITEAVITWKDGDAGTVTTDGSFTAGKVAGIFEHGILSIAEAAGDSKQNSPKITILPDPLDKAVLQTLEIAAGASKQLIAVGQDQYGNALKNLDTTWSVENSLAGTITKDGVFTASKKAVSYDAAIKVVFKQGDKTSEANGKVIIKPGDLAQAGIAPENINLGKGMTQQYVAAGADKYGNRISGITFTWSCNKDSGTITADGLFTASNNPNKYDKGIMVTAKNNSVTVTKQTTITVDADRVLFYSNRADETKEVYSVYLMNIDGTNVKRVFSISDEFLPDLNCSADGRSVVYSEMNTTGSDMFLTNVEGTWTSSITSGKYLTPAISPDGEKIVFTNDTGTSPDLYLMDMDGGNLHQLTHDTDIELYPKWSPDGKKIVYMSTPDTSANFKICVINVDGTGQKALTTGGNYDAFPSFSPDGTKMVFQSNRTYPRFYGIYVMNADGSNIVTVTANGGYSSHDPCWSPDGKKLVFHNYKDGLNAEIYVINADGTDLTRLTVTTADDFAAIWLRPAKGVLVSQESVVITASFNETELTAKEITSQSSPAVVRIKTDLGLGSGFLINPDGLILTNNHVISGAKEITVYMTDGTNYKGTVLARDIQRDIALVDIVGTKFPFLKISNLDEVGAGQKVVVLGYPLGQENVSVTSGLVSTIGFDDGRNITWLQTDSAINPGNSGGPILDMNGEVIGIVTAKVFGIGVEGIGFAISANSVNLYLHALLATAEIN